MTRPESYTGIELPARILFVCTGNICRSPFAAALADTLARQEGLVILEADSAGLLVLPGNPATPMAQRVAREYGVDLSTHSAKPVSAALVAWCDMVLVMEHSHKKALLEAYPEASDKVVFLRHFARHGSRQRGISDPYGLDYEAYRFCYLDIQDAVLGLVEHLTNRPTAFEPVRVTCYEGYKACESPRQFEWKGRTHEVHEVIDRWYEAGRAAPYTPYDYFKIKTPDGKIFILQYDRHRDTWGIMARLGTSP
ncbi:MAG: low molecular weight protein arginine phosphatase [Deltaproteobacteria bacterium]|nr:low molecular weight protein arginine phosphatase [Deltaproteobacteria bacterium]